MRAQNTGSIELKPGGRYLARLPAQYDRASLGTFDTEDDARAALTVRLGQIARAEAPGMLTVDAFGQRWLDARAKSGDFRHVNVERARWSAYITPAAIGKVPVRDVDAADVRAWLSKLTGARRARLSGSTKANALSLLRSALAGAVDDKHLKVNPAEGVKLSKGARRKTHEGWTWLTADELDDVLEAAPSPKARSLWTVGAYTGLRTGELLGLRWDDVDFGRNVVHVRHTRNDAPKTARALREVSLLEPARDALLAWRALSRDVTSRKGLVWTSPTGGCHVVGYDADFVETTAKILRRRVTIRDLRHTCASHLLQGTWAPELIERALRIEEVRDWLGHSNITVTQRYAHLSADATRSLVKTRPITGTTWPDPRVPVADAVADDLSHFRELNPGPTVYETVALPLS